MTHSEFLFPILQNNANSEIPVPNFEKRFDNPICRKCHEQYKAKFPGKPFQIDCEGIYPDEEIAELAKDTQLSFEEAKELVDAAFWSRRHIFMTNDEGDLVPYEPRWYQEEILRCSARRKVDRCGRGTGKTSTGIIEELHIVTKKAGFDILIACPAKSQAQKWYDDILTHINNDQALSESLKSKQQAPYFKFTFHNRSTISIFTTGTEAGRDAKTIRSQSPRRVRLDEQDYLNDPGDYKAILPLLRRFKNSEFHGSSTPTGKHETYYAMCTQFEDYKEFHFPITVHPDWGSKELNEEVCLREARTRANYDHEFLGLFTDAAEGVFRSGFVDLARKAYDYSECVYEEDKFYVMGVDWNGNGTGTRIRVVSFDPKTGIRRCVAKQTIDDPTSTTKKTIEAIRAVNKQWHCVAVYTDAGFGFVQDELLKTVGKTSDDPDDKRLLDVRTIDFGATLEINRLVSKRPERKKVVKGEEDDELKRRTKPFVVEGTVMVLEDGLFEYSEKDMTLDEQFRSYRVKKWTPSGLANTYECPCGDHDITALMLALLGVEMKYGLLVHLDRRKTSSAMAFVAGIGVDRVAQESLEPLKTPAEVRKAAAGVPLRTVQRSRTQTEGRIDFIGKYGGVVSPPGSSEYRATKFRQSNGPQNRQTGAPQSGFGSRTHIFTNPSRRSGFPGMGQGRYGK